jgi:hypothetical protein
MHRIILHIVTHKPVNISVLQFFEENSLAIVTSQYNQRCHQSSQVDLHSDYSLFLVTRSDKSYYFNTLYCILPGVKALSCSRSLVVIATLGYAGAMVRVQVDLTSLMTSLNTISASSLLILTTRV